MPSLPIPEKFFSQALLDVLIRAGLVAVLVIFCFDIFRPFLNLMLWAVILAITLYPLHQWLSRKIGNKEGRAATLIVLLGLALLVVPVYLLARSMAASAQTAAETFKEGDVHIPPPAASVADWPVVGKSVHALWEKAATDLSGLVKSYAPQIKEGARTLVSKLAGIGVGLLMFMGAFIVAGIVMAYGEPGGRSAERIASRVISTGTGKEVTELCTSTIRAVAQGVVGIAFIQMLLVGLGFAFMGIPGTGVLSLVVLLFGIVQLPATLITVPVIAFVLVTQGASVGTIVFAIYVFVAGLADNVLKPMLLGRGVSVPMPVILIGAIGGMVSNGILGLFVGPVALAVAYKLFWRWVDNQPQVAVPAVLAIAVEPAPAAAPLPNA